MKFPRSTPRHFEVVLLLLAALAVPACHTPADTVAHGELCLPESPECPATVDLERPGVGRNAMDLTLHSHRESEASTVALQITTEEHLSFWESRDLTDDGRTILVERQYSLGADEVLYDYLGPFDLTVASQLRLELSCSAGDCSHHLEYQLISKPLECVDDNTCSRNEFCEAVYGRCTQCFDESQCSTEQTCDRETGRCFPESTRGCTTTDQRSFIAFWLLLFLLVYAVGRRRRLSSVLIPGAVALLFFSVPLPAGAATGASMNFGGGMRTLTGDAGEMTRVGWGLTIAQRLRWHRLGLSFELTTHSFPLRVPRSEEQDSITGYGIGLGPQLFVPLPSSSIFGLNLNHPVELIFSIDYRLFGVSDNRLAPITGLNLNYHAIGPGAGLGWRWGGFHFAARANYSNIFDWPGGVFTVDVLVGIGQ